MFTKTMPLIFPTVRFLHHIKDITFGVIFLALDDTEKLTVNYEVKTLSDGFKITTTKFNHRKSITYRRDGIQIKKKKYYI